MVLPSKFPSVGDAEPVEHGVGHGGGGGPSRASTPATTAAATWPGVQT